MLKRVAAGALIGWAAIVGLAWWLASERIALCGKSWEATTSCVIRATAARDSALIWGLSIGLAAAIIFALILARRYGWGSWRPSSDQIELRSVRPADPNSRSIIGNKRSVLWIFATVALLFAAIGIWQVNRRNAIAAAESTINIDESLTTEYVADNDVAAAVEADIASTWKAAEAAYAANAAEGAEPTCEELRLVARENNLGVISCGE